jgi:hypothetical protein
MTWALILISNSAYGALRSIEAQALTELCDGPAGDLWVNCLDSVNACDSPANWPGLQCDWSNTTILRMYFSSPL